MYKDDYPDAFMDQLYIKKIVNTINRNSCLDFATTFIPLLLYFGSLNPVIQNLFVNVIPCTFFVLIATLSFFLSRNTGLVVLLVIFFLLFFGPSFWSIFNLQELRLTFRNMYEKFFGNGYHHNRHHNNDIHNQYDHHGNIIQRPNQNNDETLSPFGYDHNYISDDESDLSLSEDSDDNRSHDDAYSSGGESNISNS
jgi:hypothetical protein